MKTSYMYKYGRNCYQGARRNIRHWINSQIDSKPKLLILAYHRVLPKVFYDPLHTVITVETFRRQMDCIAKSYPIISLNDAVKQCRSGTQVSKTQVVLTFDDIYQDIYEYVFPILSKRKLPANLFLPTDYIDKNITMWDQELTMLLDDDKTIKKVEIGNKKVCKNFLQSRRSFMTNIFREMKSLGLIESQKVIKDLRKENILNVDKDRFVTWEQAKEMSDAGLEISSHGMSHRSLPMIPVREAIHEIKRSKEVIESNINKPCRHFAFPFGSRYDHNASLIDYVKEAGYETCLLNTHGYNYFKKNSFCFKRIIMEETTNVRHLFG